MESDKLQYPWDDPRVVAVLKIELGANNTVLISINNEPVISAQTVPEMEVSKMFQRELKHCNK